MRPAQEERKPQSFWRRQLVGRRFFLLPLFLLAVLAHSQGGASPATTGEQASEPVMQSKGLMQRPPEPPATPDSAKRVGQIALDVTVTDRAGQPVSGLNESNFTVLDDRQPSKIVSFRAEDSGSATDSAQAILLLDEVNNSFQSVATEREQIVKFLGSHGGRLAIPISLVLFSGSGAKMDQPTRDGRLLMSELEKMPIPVHTITSAMGGEGAVERYQLSLKTLSRLLTYTSLTPGRKLLLWIGPGWPMMSDVRFGSTVEDKHRNWDGIVTFARDFRQARTTLYSINSLSSDTAISNDLYYRDFLRPVTSAKGADSGTLALPVLAIQSGGRALNATNDLAGEIASCVAEASAYYTVAIQISTSETANEYHALEVKLDEAGLMARTNTGYYNQPYLEQPPSEFQTLAATEGKGLLTPAKEQFRQALHHGAPNATDVAFTVKVSTSTKEAKAEYRIDAQTVEYRADATGQLTAVLDCAIVEYNADGKPIATSLVRLNSNVDPKRRAALNLDGLRAEQSIALKPGAVSLVFGIRDQTTGRFGNLEVSLAGH